MEMVVSKRDMDVIGGLDISSSWEDIATVINVGTQIQKEGFNIAVAKGVEEGLYASELIRKLQDNGCTLGRKHIENTLGFYEFNTELSQAGHDPLTLNKPETEGQYRDLGSASEITSAQEKLEEFNEVGESVGKAQPSRADIVEHNKIVTEVTKSIGGEDKPKDKNSPTYFSVKETEDFRAWLKDTHNIDAVEDKPKVNMMELQGMRDDVLNDLASRVPEWKMAKKIMRKLLHPDTGGNTLGYQFFEGFVELMDNLSKAYDYVVFREKIDNYKREWWKNKELWKSNDSR